VVLAHDRRRIVYVNVTAHPTAEWTAQQLRDAFPWNTMPRYLLRDRDRMFDTTFRADCEAMGITEVLSATHAPWQRAYVERVIGSIRRECLDHIIVLNEASLRRTITSYLVYYHGARTHLSLDKDARPRHDASTRRLKAAWSRSRKLVDCTIDTSDAQPDAMRHVAHGDHRL
jgi:putative transposase